MTYPQVYRYHRFFFMVVVISAIFFLHFELPVPEGAELVITLILFFGLGIPHGALDVALGRNLFEPTFGKLWWLFFLVGYLSCIGLIVYLWILYPLVSFLFFLAISMLHFGFSDTLKNKGFLYFLEGILRGILPIATPAYFFPEKFTALVESVLTASDTKFVMDMVQSLFYPSLCILFVLILSSLLKKDRREILNIFEIVLIIILFSRLTPFRAFLIYFCFLHSLRHILSVLQEMNLTPSWRSLKWVTLQALPSTLATLAFLSICYFALKQGSVDSRLLFNLFFISLAALTFPHMLVVELVKRKN